MNELKSYSVIWRYRNHLNKWVYAQQYFFAYDPEAFLAHNLMDSEVLGWKKVSWTYGLGQWHSTHLVLSAKEARYDAARYKYESEEWYHCLKVPVAEIVEIGGVPV